MTFDSVNADASLLGTASATVFRYVQSWAACIIDGLALFFFILVLSTCASSNQHHTSRVLLLLAYLFVLLASFLRRATPYLVREAGSCRYYRVSSTATKVLPNTRQAWLTVTSLGALAAGLPLCLYLFTHYTAHGNVYGFAMFGLSGRRTSPYLAAVYGFLVCSAVMALLYGCLYFSIGGRNPFYVEASEERWKTFVRLAGWELLLIVMWSLFVWSRLLLCGGPLGRFAAVGASQKDGTCGAGAWNGIFAWLMITQSYLLLDIGTFALRLISGGSVVYYALEPRLDGLFCELLVWSLKAAPAIATVVDPIAAYVIIGCLFLGLAVFSWLRQPSSVDTLNKLIRYATLTVALHCLMSCCVSSRRVHPAVAALVIWGGWLASVGGAVALYHRQFGWELFGNEREVTAAILID